MQQNKFEKETVGLRKTLAKRALSGAPAPDTEIGTCLWDGP